MRVEPSARGAVEDRTLLRERMRTVLDRADLRVPQESLHHPAAVEIVHLVQRALRSGPLGPDRLRSLSDRLDRVPPAPVCGAAAPQGHLGRSVARALRSVPARGADAPAVTADVVEWEAAERDVMEAALGLLERVWPQSAAELRETVVEVALLGGAAIDGFTDFAVHGAVLVNRSRLQGSQDGVPGVVRCVEALVHEGAHTRCNAAAVAEPFLLPDGAGRIRADQGGPVLVATPLRADPRPLTGLFQQTVVLARSVLLYRALAGEPFPAPGPAAVGARYAKLLDGARQAVRTLAAHTDSLTPHGRTVLAECAAVIGEPARHSGYAPEDSAPGGPA
ncbi:HEXXH motif-containing putative peptide modification protein [Streptomyces laculatispora]|uniref:HEXXH motif-containing putative peptide modification protein n=1 Tax=Streptomyces laculatispora TaxID=887464 RepID=A0ABY9I6M4_9ACTN|nr:HEXXH motif-containing putative peptide modification protein [Streptomyces laculatispora]WLQ42131.1 HEXXH motif-containing putative peptide modification protein [Streptomyces laculatispora]